MLAQKQPSAKKLRAMEFSRKRWELYGYLGRIRMATYITGATLGLFIGIDHPAVASANNAITNLNSVRKHILSEIKRLNALQRSGGDLEDF